jgi:hypothetical protein
VFLGFILFFMFIPSYFRVDSLILYEFLYVVQLIYSNIWHWLVNLYDRAEVKYQKTNIGNNKYA